MDIELNLRQLLVLRDPGVRFTDGVMARLESAPPIQLTEGVVRLADARARRRSRRILIVTVVAVAAAAAIPLVLHDSKDPPPAMASTSAVDAIPTAEPLDAGTEESDEEQGEKDDPLACLDPDVLQGLLLQAYSSPAFSLDAVLPAELGSFKAPARFTWVGSTLRKPVVSSVAPTVAAVYRTTLAPAAALTEAGHALNAGGWQAHSSGLILPMGILRGGDERVAGGTYCREGQPVSLSAGAIDGVTYVVLTVTRNQDRTGNGVSTCEQPPQPMVPRSSPLEPFMPVLDAPRDRETGRPVAVMAGSSSNGNTKRSATASFVIQDSVGNVAQHLSTQMAAQGWTAEASWIGGVTAGSTWTRRIDTDTSLQGTLLVSVFHEDRFTVVFNVVTTK